MSKVVRSVKNVTKGYSAVQVKVRNATSNDHWGTGTEMAEIASLTFGSPTDFYEIMDMLDKRLNDKGKNWRHVLKSLKVLDYALHEGSELVVTWARKNVYIIKTLREFQYVDEDGRDVGQDVRVAAKELTALILDEDRLRSERSDRKLWKSRVNGLDDYQSYGNGAQPRRAERRERRRQTDDDDAEYRLAIEASKHEADEERKRRAKQAVNGDDDEELAQAIKLSKEEEELRRRELEQSNAQSLFDDAPPAQPQPTGYNQGYQQQSAVDWFGNPINPQQPLTTGYLNNQYANTTGFQGQVTGYNQNPYGQNNFLQPQATLQPQHTAFSNNNPYGTDVYSQQHQQQPQDNNMLSAGSNNPWATGPQADALKPMPTGSNNPFAQRTQFQQPRPATSSASAPSLNTLSEERATNQFASVNPITSYQTPQIQQPMQPYAPPRSTPPQMDPHTARLNALLASGEGQDTFGNTGDLRIPAQHTAPGTFVNSAGQGLDRLRATRTGNNPFYGQPQQQFVPQQTGFTQPTNNPWGGQPAYQPQQQGGSLIDL
ncbi:EH domain binding protein [Aspergillus rambellii]|uniref:EH domain binding protein n=2 Tax=Aspergillus subgen. Nidulantes TaxID=2720870 RepID=A0A0F8UBS7_9EURO|nr:EH domain binding protein [Aspergillus ochraceoroseus]KKK17144.1 EH domain binding protein [Aspergillus rambellii]